MDEYAVVHTLAGDVQGRWERGAAIFRGIPYGQCERFMPPTAAQSWPGVRDCTRNGPIAMQAGGSICASEGLGDYFSGGHRDYFGPQWERQSEDCLCLNVVTPRPDDEKRAVLVYIHGGGYEGGSGTLVLGGEKLALEQNIVLVGVNHRLNAFGYLYLGHLDEKYVSSGMAGMLDLAAALMWVRDNIAHFGGDPNRVTIMGESGGGMKVSTLMAMPAAKGLFCRAIVESGSAPVGAVGREAGARTANELLARLNIAPESWRELLSVPASRILSALAGEGRGLRTEPVANGIDLPENPEGKYDDPALSAQIPLMVGSSQDEMAVFIPWQKMEEITWENIADALCRDSRFTDAQARKAVRVFRARDEKGVSPGHLYVHILSMRGFLGGGAYYQAMARAQGGGAPVFHYEVAFDSPLPARPQTRYAWHTADLPLQMGLVQYAACAPLSRRLMAALGAFVRTGDPSVPDLPWPPFTAKEKCTMVFDEECRTARASDPILFD